MKVENPLALTVWHEFCKGLFWIDKMLHLYKLNFAELTFFVVLYSLSTQEHHTSANQMKKLLCEFVNSILTDLDAGKMIVWKSFVLQ